jgi:bifunctional ADP-heptose synthase (sugar kinase/adenylyltransferase)
LTARAPAFERQFCAPAELAARVAALPRPRVFTNSCFDIPHRGHVTYLAEARTPGASLVVGVNTDVSVKRLGKGGDWLPDSIVGAAEVKSWGGTVHSIPFQHQTSTSALLDRIRTP